MMPKPMPSASSRSDHSRWRYRTRYCRVLQINTKSERVRKIKRQAPQLNHEHAASAGGHSTRDNDKRAHTGVVDLTGSDDEECCTAPPSKRIKSHGACGQASRDAGVLQCKPHDILRVLSDEEAVKEAFKQSDVDWQVRCM